MALRCAIVTKLPYMTEDENNTCNTRHGGPAGPEPAGIAQGCSIHTALKRQDMLLAYSAHLKLKSIMVITEKCDCWCAVLKQMHQQDQQQHVQYIMVQHCWAKTCMLHLSWLSPAEFIACKGLVHTLAAKLASMLPISAW